MSGSTTAVETLREASLEHRLQNDIPLLRGGQTVVITLNREAREVLVLLELAPSVQRWERVHLHSVAAQLQKRAARLVTRAGYRCRDVVVVSRSSLQSAERDESTYVLLKDRFLAGTLSRFRDGGELAVTGALSVSNTVQIRIERPRFLRYSTEVVRIDINGKSLTLIGHQASLMVKMLLSRSSVGTGQIDHRFYGDAVRRVLNQINSGSARISVPSPTELGALVARSRGDHRRILRLYTRLLHLGVLQEDQASPMRPPESQPAVLLRRNGSNKMYLVFTGGAAMDVLQMPPVDFLKQTKLIESNVLMLRDRLGAFYTRGISTDVRSIDQMVSYLRGCVDTRAEITDVYAVGTSMGAFAAVLYGCLLQLPSVWAFGVPRARYRNVDLRKILSRSNGLTTYHLYYNRGYAPDRAVAESLARFSGVRLYPQDGSGHYVAQELWRQQRLGEVFSSVSEA